MEVLKKTEPAGKKAEFVFLFGGKSPEFRKHCGKIYEE